MKKEIVKILISFILFIIALILPFENSYSTITLYVISYLIVGSEIILKAIKNIFKGEIFDENFLMSVATLGAFGIGEFPEAVAVMLFYQVGELFQDYAVDKSKKSISNLVNIRPDFANVQRDNKIIKVEPNDVKIGEIIIVKPGEKIPLDGKIIDGNSMLDTMALTGESIPKEVSKGDEALSGCINKNAVLTIQVTKQFGDSTVTKILNLVENASNRKSKSEKFITKFAKIYTPTVVIIAIILAILPPLLMEGHTFSDWIYRALSFLVVSCPCALVISIPLSFFAGIGGASKVGILIKGGNYLEALANIETVVFDKTGTLTQGVFEVQKVEAIGVTKEELIKIATYAENYSNHPIALSLKKEYAQEIDTSKIASTQEISGLGIQAEIEDKNILIGNEKLMIQNEIEFSKCNEVGTILYVAINNVYAGYILISDKLKNDSKDAINKLKDNNIKNIVMLTGDKKEVGEDVAKKLGIDTVFSALLPDEKVENLEKLLKNKSEDKKIAFVGDGINDAPVLAMADIGIAMGGLGSDAAIEIADVVIMTDEPSKVIDAIKISRKTMRIVRENIVFAISIKILILILSALGISTMWEAVFADVGVSVIAIINALRALRP